MSDRMKYYKYEFNGKVEYLVLALDDDKQYTTTIVQLDSLCIEIIRGVYPINIGRTNTLSIITEKEFNNAVKYVLGLMNIVL